jgi:hypothetical protein
MESNLSTSPSLIEGIFSALFGSTGGSSGILSGRPSFSSTLGSSGNDPFVETGTGEEAKALAWCVDIVIQISNEARTVLKGFTIMEAVFIAQPIFKLIYCFKSFDT